VAIGPQHHDGLADQGFICWTAGPRAAPHPVCQAVHAHSIYGWAFGLPENFGSGSSGFGYFGFPKMLHEISLEKEEPENSGSGLPDLPEIEEE